METFITYVEYLVGGIMATQVGYALAILIGGRIVTDYYEWGYYDKPESFLDKAQNIFLDTFLGMGYHIDKKLRKKYSWIKRKLLYLLIITGISIVFIFSFFSISDLLRWLLL
ncbi:hypothetical protein [Bacillus sp. T33-2]|uniref:hypothetical protein n=1 Tax=Bacillus sp. T33-2 TaxID=2054168 RepID=UPI000C755FC9|nr:hypothetical protein [Bacillus sp. T33-2]PLR92662.1 hypothetical protein CVD19_20620 [Bacillus sp. T33-2]